MKPERPVRATARADLPRCHRAARRCASPNAGCRQPSRRSRFQGDCELRRANFIERRRHVVPRLYHVPFDYDVADALTRSLSSSILGIDGRQITDYLIEYHNGPMATRATAPSSLVHH